jgi:hypothetical protein
MRISIAVLSMLACAVAGGAFAQTSPACGPGSGRLILSITTGPGAPGYNHELFIRREGDPQEQMINYDSEALFGSRSDFKDPPPAGDQKWRPTLGLLLPGGAMRDAEEHMPETGVVRVKCLEPGRYELDRLVEDAGGAVVGYAYYARKFEKHAALMFDIQAGRSTYLGNFKVVGVGEKNIFGVSVPAGARYIVQDKSERDLAIARKKDPGIAEVDVAVPDVASLNDAAFSSHE